MPVPKGSVSTPPPPPQAPGLHPSHPAASPSPPALRLAAVRPGQPGRGHPRTAHSPLCPPTPTPTGQRPPTHPTRAPLPPHPPHPPPKATPTVRAADDEHQRSQAVATRQGQRDALEGEGDVVVAGEHPVLLLLHAHTAGALAARRKEGIRTRNVIGAVVAAKNDGWCRGGGGGG